MSKNGQHESTASYIGSVFSSNKCNKTKNRQKEITVIKILDFIENEIKSKDDLNKLKKEKPAEKIFTSHSIISKEKELENNINIIENLGQKDLNKNEDIYNNKNITDFIALHSSRNLTNYYLIIRLIKNAINKNKNKISLIETPVLNLLKGKERKEVGDILCDFFLKKLTIDNTKEIEEISKKIFNIYWVSELNRNKNIFFKKYWLEIDMESGIIGVASNLVIDFNHPIHNIENFNMYKELDLELQKMIKSSIIFCRSDNKIAIGIDEKYKNTINNYFNVKENVESFEYYFINKFLPMYILTVSRDYIYIPSERYIDIIMENKEELKEFYIKNNIENSIFRKVKT